MGHDNVFMLDGVDVVDNLFGTPQNLFIEDAIEETQILTLRNFGQRAASSPAV